MPDDAPVCLLTFDVEEYFQIEAAREVVGRERWDARVGRLDGQLDWLLRTLDDHDSRATFFILGWVARRQRHLVRRIADAGHEIACHGFAHDRLHRLTPDEARLDIRTARALLQDISGQPVIGYRAPTFSLDRRTAWAVDLLAEAGFEYDSSIQPIRRPAYGVPDAPRYAHRLVGPGGGELLEIPPLTWRVGRYRLPVAGGGYFRLLPLRCMLNGIAQAHRAAQPAMCYFHPWEFDPDQPRLGLRGLRRLRTYVGLNRSRLRLVRLMQRHGGRTVGHWLSTQAPARWAVHHLSQSRALASDRPHRTAA